MKKWITNSEEVNAVLVDLRREESLVNIQVRYNTTYQTSGLEWNIEQCVFQFYVNELEKPPIKRGT